MRFMKEKFASLSMVLLLITLGFNAPPPAGAYQGGSKNENLKQKAKKAGKYVRSDFPPAAAFNDLTQLVSRSSQVVIGSAQQNVCRLSGDGTQITTDYQVTLEHVYKGNLSQGNIITVSLPGGLLRFPDGTSAEVRTPWFKKMQQGSTYLFFLNPADGGKYVIVGDAQGLFEIPTTKKSRLVKSQSGRSQDPIWKYNDLDVIVFLKQVRAATK